MDKITVYIDSDFRCYTEAGEGRRAVETNAFNNRENVIPLYRFVPQGEIWKRSDGEVFIGEMISPFQN